ncbi:hypothetical protein lerEdw1_020667 [Lerista edwardsae]|nr:hypothetical protein lerEdw1_020667 [Lerista edwardsae]
MRYMVASVSHHTFPDLGHHPNIIPSPDMHPNKCHILALSMQTQKVPSVSHHTFPDPGHHPNIIPSPDMHPNECHILALPTQTQKVLVGLFLDVIVEGELLKYLLADVVIEGERTRVAHQLDVLALDVAILLWHPIMQIEIPPMDLTNHLSRNHRQSDLEY